MRGLFILLSLTLTLGACDAASSDDAGVDAGGALFDASLTDAGHPDGGLPDAGPSDAGSGADDAGLPDSGEPDGGANDRAGTIEGPCGVLDEELIDTTMSFLVRNTITFDERWSSADDALVSEGARKILTDGTAGGSSSYSEAFAFEVLHRCEGAELIKSETEIEYDSVGGRTDMLVELDGLRIGVSVTRVFTVTDGRTCMRGADYPPSEAQRILTEKLASIASSSMNVTEADSWVKQVLFVFADTAAHGDVIESVWNDLDPATRGDTVLFISVSEGEDIFIYFEDRCA